MNSTNLGYKIRGRDIDGINEENASCTCLVVQWKNLPFNGGFDPWSGKIPHAAEQLSVCTSHQAYVP